VEDLDGLGAQRAVERLVVGVRELARAVVELGVADLAVLGLARGLEVSEVTADGRVRAARDPQRPRDEQHDDEQGRQHQDEARECHRGLTPAPVPPSRPARVPR
jgi:hypothetical protein